MLQTNVADSGKTEADRTIILLGEKGKSLLFFFSLRYKSQGHHAAVSDNSGRGITQVGFELKARPKNAIL